MQQVSVAVENKDEARRRDETLILALSRGASQQEAATEAGCHRATVVRRMKSLKFRRRVAKAREQLIDEGIGSLSSKIKAALEALADLLKSESEITKLGAAKALASMLLPLRAQQDFEARLAAIEDQLKGSAR